MSAASLRRHSPHRFALCALSAWAAFATAGASAACIESRDPEIRAYTQRLGRDPAGVEQEVSARLQRGGDTDPLQRAGLYGVLAEAYASLERYEEVRGAADRGLALVPDPRNDVHVNLLHYGASNSYDEASRPGAIERTQAALRMQVPGSPGDACLLTALGVLEHLSGRIDQASIYLTRAYGMSQTEGRAPQRIAAAEVLAIVMRDLRDLPQALALNDEVIAWNERHAPFRVATARFMRGAILRESGDHTAALAEFAASRRLAVITHDALGTAYADLFMCASNVKLGELRAARAQCNDAWSAFSAAKSTDPTKQALTTLAEIDLRESMPAAALEKLDRVLDHEGSDIAPFRLETIYELRARAHAQLGHDAAALSDFENYMQRYKAGQDAVRAREAASLRAHMETDREIARNASLQRELEIKNDKLSAQSARLQWMMVSALAGTALIVLLAYLLVSAKKKKRLLAQLARHDDLTGLPNRRRTLELANEAFAAARAQRSPLTIGILDLDHFKQINDRFGHATGDLVLQAFAQVGREAVRSDDVLGRWGGEEFLIILPGTTLDVALGIVERIRDAVGQISVAGRAPGLKVSVSAGLATNEDDPARVEDIVASADTALYEAKQSGRDGVRVAQESFDVAATGIRRNLRQAGVELTTGRHSRG